MSDENLNKIEELLAKHVIPLKEILEVVQDKVRKLDTFQNLVVDQTRSIKEQLSVVNQKIDELKKTQNEHSEALQQHTVALLGIESTITG